MYALLYPLKSYSVCSEQAEWSSEVRNPLKSHSSKQSQVSFPDYTRPDKLGFTVILTVFSELSYNHALFRWSK